MFLGRQQFPDGNDILAASLLCNQETSLSSEIQALKFTGAAENKTHHSIVTDIRQHCGYPNIHNLTEVGAHPRRWTEMLINWKNQNIQYALPKSGRPGAPPYFGSDFVVIVVDAHNGLQLGHSYTGLKYKSLTGKTIFEEYNAFLFRLAVIFCTGGLWLR